MAMLSKAVLATAVISTGLLSSTGMAMAGGNDSADDAHGHSSHTHSHGDGTTSNEGGVTYQRGLINSGDIKPNTSPDLCNNDVPVNALGVQIPVQDVAASLGLLSKSGEGSNSSKTIKGCSSPSAS